jgi:hypothetical protein
MGNVLLESGIHVFSIFFQPVIRLVVELRDELIGIPNDTSSLLFLFGSRRASAIVSSDIAKRLVHRHVFLSS